MKLPWQKDPPASETDEQKKKREEEEQTAFFGRIGELVKNEVKPIAEKVDGLDSEWKKLKETAAAGDEEHNEDDSNLSEDEKRRRNDEIEKRKLLAISIATNARITENEVISEFSSQFPELIPKLKETFAKTPLERKGQEDYGIYCRNCVKYLVGEAAMNGGLRYNQAEKRFFLEDQGGGGDHETYDFLGSEVTWQDPRSGAIMTGRDQLAKLGIKPEEFAESQKKGIV